MGLLKLLTAGEEPVINLAADQAAYVARGFGLFICFNMSTFTGDEHAHANTPVNTFNPSALSVQQWIDTAVAMGAKSICLTYKHHDGFLLGPSSTTTHTIASTSWYAGEGGVNIIREFVRRAKAAGLAVGIYVSVLDRYWEQFDGSAEDQAGYLLRSETQIREVLTLYGRIDFLWLDAAEWYFSGTAFPWASAAARRDFIKGLQPQCLIVNNNHMSDFDLTDIRVYEGGTVGSMVPADNTLPAEVVDTMRVDDNWFWKSSGNDCLSAEDILSALATCNSRNAAYLLAPPVDNTGVIPANMVSILEEVGAALA